MFQFYILTHILGKQILQIYLERCLFRLLQAFSSTISRLQILHCRPFKGLRPDFLICTNFHGILYTHYNHISFVGFSIEITSTYKLCQKLGTSWDYRFFTFRNLQSSFTRISNSEKTSHMWLSFRIRERNARA